MADKTKTQLVAAIKRKLKSIDVLETKLTPLQVKKKQLDSELDELKFQLLKLMGEAKEDAFTSSNIQFRVSKLDHYQIADWSAMCKEVKKSGHFELFTKRINSTAFKEIYADDNGAIKLPKWSKKFTKVDLKLKTLKGK
jgi:hypothetical protein